MKRIFFTLIFVCFGFQVHAARPWPVQMSIRPFQWEGREIRDFEEMFQTARKLTTREQADAFKKALQTTNSHADEALNYASGEFTIYDDRRTFSELFQIDHPAFGTFEENSLLTGDARQVLGLLMGAGIRGEKLKPFRQVFLRVPAPVMRKVFYDIIAKFPEQPTLDFVQSSIEKHSKTCTEPFDPKAPFSFL